MVTEIVYLALGAPEGHRRREGARQKPPNPQMLLEKWTPT